LELYIRSHYTTSLVAWSTLHLLFADNYIATICSLQPCLYCVLILLQGLAAFHECVCGSVKRDESNNFKESSQWAYEGSSTEETNSRVTVKTSIQSVLHFTATFADHIHEFKCILATTFLSFFFSG